MLDPRRAHDCAVPPRPGVDPLRAWVAWPRRPSSPPREWDLDRPHPTKLPETGRGGGRRPQPPTGPTRYVATVGLLLVACVLLPQRPQAAGQLGKSEGMAAQHVEVVAHERREPGDVLIADVEAFRAQLPDGTFLRSGTLSRLSVDSVFGVFLGVVVGQVDVVDGDVDLDDFQARHLFQG